MPLHVFGHVEAHQLDAHAVGQLAGDLGLADAGRAGEEEAADRLRGLPRPERDILIALASASMALSWPNTTDFRSRSRSSGRRGRRSTRAARDAGDLGDDLLDLGLADDLLLLGLRQDALRRAGLVDDVDGLVRQVAVVDVAGGELGGAARWRWPSI
jgi:hypothetical protein